MAPQSACHRWWAGVPLWHWASRTLLRRTLAQGPVLGTGHSLCCFEPPRACLAGALLPEDTRDTRTSHFSLQLFQQSKERETQGRTLALLKMPGGCWEPLRACELTCPIPTVTGPVSALALPGLPSEKGRRLLTRKCALLPAGDEIREDGGGGRPTTAAPSTPKRGPGKLTLNKYQTPTNSFAEQLPTGRLLV